MVHPETVVIEKRGTTPELKLEMVTKQLALLYEVVAQLNLLVALDFQIQTIGFGEKTRSVAGCFEEAYLEYCSVIGKVGIALEIQYSHESPDQVNLVYCLQKSQGLVFLS
jgi:hypothetical protein